MVSSDELDYPVIVFEPGTAALKAVREDMEAPEMFGLRPRQALGTEVIDPRERLLKVTRADRVGRLFGKVHYRLTLEVVKELTLAEVKEKVLEELRYAEDPGSAVLVAIRKADSVPEIIEFLDR